MTIPLTLDVVATIIIGFIWSVLTYLYFVEGRPEKWPTMLAVTLACGIITWAVWNHESYNDPALVAAPFQAEYMVDRKVGRTHNGS